MKTQTGAETASSVTGPADETTESPAVLNVSTSTDPPAPTAIEGKYSKIELNPNSTEWTRF